MSLSLRVSLRFVASAALPIVGSAQLQGPPLVPANVSAELEVAAPGVNEFVLHGTVPWPRGVVAQAYVIDADGTWVPAQTEIVSRYPGINGVGGGADVVEVLARVHRDPATPVGTHVSYPILAATGLTPPNPGTPDFTDLATGPANVPLAIQGLVVDPGAIVIRAETVVGAGVSQFYYAYPLQSPNLRTERHGSAMATLRTYDVMMPDPPIAGTEYPHLFGVHTYISTVTDEPALLMDLRFTNAPDGHGGTAGLLLGDTHWKRIDLLIASDANSWTPMADFADPYIWQAGNSVGSATLGGRTYSVYPIVKPIRVTAGELPQMHWSPCRSQFHRRIAIAAPADQAVARRLLDQEGLGFARKGTNGQNDAYWSWFNPLTARYFPQRDVLPTLDFAYTVASCPGLSGLPALRCLLTQRFDQLRNALAGNTPIPGPQEGSFWQLGWARPYDRENGLNADGKGIVMVEGDRVVAAAHVDGYRHLMLQHRMNTERQPNVIYEVNGDATHVEDWITDDPNNPDLVPGCSSTPGTPDINNNPSWQYFGYWQDRSPVSSYFPCSPWWPATAFNWAQEQGVNVWWKLPDYQTNTNAQKNLGAFESHGVSHLTRYTRFPLALSWIGNDPLAKDDVRTQGELFRFEYSEYPTCYASHTQSLLAAMQNVAANPSRGNEFGRATGWGLNVANAAYALARKENSDAVRKRYRKWYGHVLDTFAQAQTNSFDPDYPYAWGKLEVRGGGSCYGCDLWCGSVTCTSTSCGPVPCPSAQQTWEEMILDNALRGMARTVYAPSEAEVGQLEAILEKSYYGLVCPISWNELGNHIWGKVGIRDTAGVDYDADETGSGSGTHPHPGFPYEPHGTEAYHYFFAMLGDAWDLTQDPFFLDRALLYLTGTSCGTGCVATLRAALENPGLPSPTSPWSPVGDDSHYDSWPQRAVLLGRMQQ